MNIQVRHSGMSPNDIFILFICIEWVDLLVPREATANGPMIIAFPTEVLKVKFLIFYKPLKPKLFGSVYLQEP